MPIPGDPSSYDEFVFDPQSGQTIRLPSSLSPFIGLPRAQPQIETYDPNDAGPYVSQPPPPAPAPAPLPADQQVDQWVAKKRDEYTRFGATPEQIAAWTNRDRERFQKFLAPQSQTAHIAQATGPVGTIGQIGRDMPAVAHDASTLQADLDAAVRDRQDAAALIPPPATPPAVAAAMPEQAGVPLQQQGIDLQERAAQQTGQADAAAATAEEQAIAERNKRLEEERTRAVEEDKRWQQRRQEIEGRVSADTDAWAKHKIDPGRRWRDLSTGRKIGAAISVAMTALGDALQKKSGPNLALGMITKSIEDDVNLQVSERQHLGEVAQRSRTSLDDYRKNYGDWQSARSLKLAEEYKRTADEIERIAAGLKSERAKANTLAMVGELRGRAGALEQGTAMSAWNREMKQAEFAEQRRHAKAQEGLAWAGQKQQAYQFGETMKFNREKLAADQKADADKYLATATAAQAKDLRENGIKDPTTGEYIIADGKPVMGRNVAEAGKIQETVDGTQTMLSTIDRIKAKIASDPGFAKLNPTQKQAALSSEIDALTLLIKDAYTTGALDEGSIRFTHSYTGGDPTKITANGLFGALGIGADPGEKTIAKLDVVAKNAETRALNRLGNPKGYKFTRTEIQKPSEANKAAEALQRPGATAASAAEAEEPGAISRGLQDLESFVFGTTQQYKTRQKTAEEKQSLKYPGFRVEKEKDLDVLVGAAKQGDAEAQKRLVEMAGNQKVAGLSEATMTLIESELEPLLPEALAALPEDKRSLRQAIYAARARTPGIRVYPGAGVAPARPTRRDSILTPDQEAQLLTVPEQWRAAARTAMEAQVLRGGQ